MSRVFLFILDSVGIGGAPDAAKFGDGGANTVGHIADHRELKIPNLVSLGMARALQAASGSAHGLDVEAPVKGAWGFATEVSHGKDTITGHWEMAGVPLKFEWGYFPDTIPAFPESFTGEFIREAKIPGILGNKHASGTEIIVELGVEHMQSGKPIVYTSADSVIQVAAHEETFGLQRLYDVCKIARELSYKLNIGRVIARPFVGTAAGNFKRTGNRKDYAVLPPSPTLLDVLSKAGRDVVSIGKIGDIYAHSGTGREIKVAGHDLLFQTTLENMDGLKDGGFLMTNFVDFDMDYGHRRDVQGYGAALEHFDAQLPQIFSKLRKDDLLVIAADHGNDPTWKGTDHTRECIPVLSYSNEMTPGSIGRRKTFADIGQTIARHLAVPPLKTGESWLL
jgi:phosphopentomutase